MNDKNFEILTRILDEDLEAIRYAISALGQDLFYEDDHADWQLDNIEYALDGIDKAIEQLKEIKKGELE